MLNWYLSNMGMMFNSGSLGRNGCQISFFPSPFGEMTLGKESVLRSRFVTVDWRISTEATSVHPVPGSVT